MGQQPTECFCKKNNCVVIWHQWGNETLEKARKENKPIFIFSTNNSCYYCCRTMHECLGHKENAEILNSKFISIKVDRFNLPHVDRYYYKAVELIAGESGWPVMCFVTPDAKPFFGGNNFSVEEFGNIANGLYDAFINNRQKVDEIANEIAESLNDCDIIRHKAPITTVTNSDIKLIIEPWRRKFDMINGGIQELPKIAFPDSLFFLLLSGYYLKDDSLYDYIDKTLTKMAEGGIYDQINGGFFRYSTDKVWHVPRFEKMLYDNTQHLYAYSLAYSYGKKPLYKNVIENTINFLQNTLKSPSGMYYTSVNACYKSKEGGYYKWTADELREIIGSDAELLFDYFGVMKNDQNWNILRVNACLQSLSEKYKMPEKEIQRVINEAKTKLFEANKMKVKPEIDEKIILTWNSLTIRSFCEAYIATGNKQYLNYAKETAKTIIDKYIDENFHLYRSIQNEKINGFLDDYATTANCMLKLYVVTGNKEYFDTSIGLIGYILENFYDSTGLFFYTDIKSEEILPRRMDIIDKSHPSSNSLLALTFEKLYFITGQQLYRNLMLQMIANVKPIMKGAGPHAAFWASNFYSHLRKQYIMRVPSEDIDKAICSKPFTPNLMVVPESEYEKCYNENIHYIDRTQLANYSDAYTFASENRD